MFGLRIPAYIVKGLRNGAEYPGHENEEQELNQTEDEELLSCEHKHSLEWNDKRYRFIICFEPYLRKVSENSLPEKESRVEIQSVA